MKWCKKCVDKLALSNPARMYEFETSYNYNYN